MPYSSSLTDREWEIIEPLLPKKKRTKPPTWSKREILDGVLYQLKNGCNWCDLPKDLPLNWHGGERQIIAIKTPIQARVLFPNKPNRAAGFFLE
jgi:transposase